MEGPRVGDRVRLQRVPPWVDRLPADVQELFARCVGQVVRVDGVDEHGQLELSVWADGTQAPDYCQHTLYVEPEYVERDDGPDKD